jgi:hypothetical protein
MNNFVLFILEKFLILNCLSWVITERDIFEIILF